MRPWRSWPELGVPIAQAIMEALPIHALMVVIAAQAEGAVPLSFVQLAGLQVSTVLWAKVRSPRSKCSLCARDGRALQSLACR